MRQETLELLENRIVQNLKDMEDHGIGSEEREAMTKEVCDLVEKLNESERINLDAWDKEKRREIEQEKNENTAEIERAKQDVTWKRALLQIGDKTIPILVSGGILAAVGAVVMTFEETGRINSTFGRFWLNRLQKL